MTRLLLGVQAQVSSVPALALTARAQATTAESVRRALVGDRSVVRTWAMRGTLHLVAAEDFGWLVPLVTEPRVANARRRLKEENVTAEQAARAVGLIERIVERDGPLTRPEIAERLRRRRIPTDGQAIAHIVWLAASGQTICFGPDRGREETYVLVRDWLGNVEPMERGAALAELAVRYLVSHAPADPRDLAAWSGIRLTDARRGWRSIEDRLVEVRTTRGPAWRLRSRSAQAPRNLVRLLPAFDEYLLGWKDRSIVAPAGRSKINRGGGWLHPVVIANGQAVGTWRTKPSGDGLRLEVDPFADLSPSVHEGIVREVAAVSACLGLTVALED